MPSLKVITQIQAPLQRCFDLARDVEVHTQTARTTHERIVGEVRDRLLEKGDTVTFEGVHFGIHQRLTARIVEFDAPRYFADEMVSGPFRSLRHVHEFAPAGGGTLMTDTFTWTSPLGPLGRLADVFLRPYLETLLRRRNEVLKQMAEDGKPG